MRVVVVDDQVRMVELVTGYLAERGIEAIGCFDGESGLATIDTERPDAVVLDLMLPMMSGTGVCKALRAAGNDVPILMLTARGEVSERVAGLEAGADDYLVKPFALDELHARLRAIARRREASDTRLVAGDVVVETDTRRVLVGGVEVAFARREFDLLATLMDPPGRVVSRQRLYDEVWDGEADLRSNALEVYVSRVRSHLKGSADVSITTMRGIGYRLDVRR
ncbi:response regulator transcription factor [Nocardioides pocheonensis]|uniref:DNA-binding response regulator n=1 Tax=Nocardioides pocheonensis TaxID=661485 RepID=A0A3N0GZ45_9ACTN|nr:response regulator transcription factor [Nocardioides pocheonensis]RNM17745.1 DNA-binding response regulator [Nocardioides pocheonensis]